MLDPNHARHAQPGFFTVLATDGGDGLEVKAAGRWADAPTLRGALLVVLGASAQRAAGGRFLTARYRIVNWGDATRVAIPASFHLSALTPAGSTPFAAAAAAAEAAFEGLPPAALPRPASPANAIASLLPGRRSSACRLGGSTSRLMPQQSNSQKQLSV